LPAQPAAMPMASAPMTIALAPSLSRAFMSPPVEGRGGSGGW